MENNIVYKYVNMINGKIYVGRTAQSLKSRAGKNGKGYRTCAKFWNAICKYGWENFSLEILADNLSVKESIEMEKQYIKTLHSNEDEFGYNILSQEPGFGRLSEETKQKIRKAHIGLKKGMHKREKSKFRRPRSEEHCRHLSESLKGNTPWNKGLKTGPLKEETKRKMSNLRRTNTNSIHVAVKDLSTGEIFRSGAEAGRAIGCSSEAIFASIRESRPCKGHYFERICE